MSNLIAFFLNLQYDIKTDMPWAQTGFQFEPPANSSFKLLLCPETQLS